MTNAISAPDITPGRMSGSVTLSSVRTPRAERPRDLGDRGASRAAAADVALDHDGRFRTK
jgi:hypothetical protein